MSNSLCIRCGKERVPKKSWNEYIGTSLVTHTSYVCPDPKCQAYVDEKFKKEQEHTDAIKANSLERKKQMKEARSLKKKKS